MMILVHLFSSYLHLSMCSFPLSLSSPVTFLFKADFITTHVSFICSAIELLASACECMVDFLKVLCMEEIPHNQLSSHFIDLIYTYFWNSQRLSGCMSTSYSHFWVFVLAIIVSLLSPLHSIFLFLGLLR